MPKVSEFTAINAAAAQLAYVVPVVDPLSNALTGNMIISLEQLRIFLQDGD